MKMLHKLLAVLMIGAMVAPALEAGKESRCKNNQAKTTYGKQAPNAKPS